MQTVKVTALRQLVGDFGRVAPGQEVAMRADEAENLEARGLVVRVPIAEYKAAVPTEQPAKGPGENKAIIPGENKGKKK